MRKELIIITLLVLFPLISASNGIDIYGFYNPSLPSFPSDDYWKTNIGFLENVNSTQFENNGGTLSILESWLNTFLNYMTGDITTTGYVYSKNQVAQYHSTTTQAQSSANTWKNITWDLYIPSESTDSWYTLQDSNQTVYINVSGIIRVQGCIHPYADSSGWFQNEETLRVRVLVDGEEARCLQASRTGEWSDQSVDILPYIGTIPANKGSKIQVQWRVTDTDIKLEGDTVFDNPVSASINLEKISILD